MNKKIENKISQMLTVFEFYEYDVTDITFAGSHVSFLVSSFCVSTGLIKRLSKITSFGVSTMTRDKISIDVFLFDYNFD